MFRRLPPALALLLAASAAAATYDPGMDRAALRGNASACMSSIVDATGLALTAEKVPAITAGIDEGLRLSRLAADAARSLEAAARERAAELEAAAGALDRKVKELAEPVAAERRRAVQLAFELPPLERRIEALPPEERDKLRPLAAKAADALRSADEALRPAEEAVKALGAAAAAMKDARRDGLKPLLELSAGTSGTILRADELPRAAAETKDRLGSLADAAARARAVEKIEILRDVARRLFEAADWACNRADDYRRRSASYEDASAAFEKTKPAASAAGAKLALDRAHRTLAQIRERLKNE